MNDRYLEVTYRRGRPIAAYLYLPRPAEALSARTQEASPGLLVDYSPTGQPIGIEITDPAHASVDRINAVLDELGLPGVSAEDLAPLPAA